MKKLNKKGFTLIELLAVIVIMGILMLVAIPAISRYIKNSRKDTYINTVKEMVNVAKNANADRDSSLDGCSFNDGDYTIYMKSEPPVLDNATDSPMKSGEKIVVKVTFNDYKVSTISASDGTNGFTGKTLSQVTRGNLDDQSALSKDTNDCEISE